MRKAGAAIARTIQDLRHSNTSVDEFVRVGSSTFRQTVAGIYRDYIDYLASHAVLDEAGVFQEAVRILDADTVRPRMVTLIILDEVELSDVSLRFVRSLEKRVERFYRIGPAGETHRAPPHTAKVLLHDWPGPFVSPLLEAKDPVGSDAPAPFASPNINIVEAIGSDNEVRAVFRSIIRERIPFDTVELSYTAHQPYLSVIRTLASRYDIPITLAAGVPVLSTRVGQAVRQFLRWISEGCPSRHLAEMIRGGYILFPETNSSEYDLAPAIAAMLDRIRIRGGVETYRQALGTLGGQHQGGQTSRSSAGSDAGRDASASHNRFIETESVFRLLQLASIPTPVTLQDVADRLRQFIYDFVVVRREVADTGRAELPAEAPAGAPAEMSADESVEASANTGTEEGLPDALVVTDLMTRLSQLGEAIPEPLPAEMLIVTILRLLDEAFVCARVARSGCVHVSPLSSAGYTGRPRLFIVGMDELTVGRAVSEDPLLGDADRESLRAASGNRLKLSSEASGLHSWSFERARARSTGDVTLVYSSYDVAEDRELYPSSILLALGREFGIVVGRGKPQSWIPWPGSIAEYWPLDLTDAYLAIRSASGADTACDRDYPWIGRGRVAESSRSSTDWTSFDGLVSGSHSEFNLFDPSAVLSASRLETFAACPFRYFVRHMLGIRSREEVREDQWLNPLERGRIIHDVLRQFMSRKKEMDEPVTAEDAESLERMLLSELDRIQVIRDAPNPAVRESERLRMTSAARTFVSDELERQDHCESFAFEFGFGGVTSMQSENGFEGPVTLDMDGLKVTLRGSVDRIDRLENGGFSITDYKTGSSTSFDPRELLNGGKTLQWALYAYAIEHILKEPVHRSGYLFLGSREMGLRLEDTPASVKDDVVRDLKSFERLSEAGLFAQAAKDKGVCAYCDFRAVCGDIPDREAALKMKLGATGEDAVLYPALENWRYAKKKLAIDT